MVKRKKESTACFLAFDLYTTPEITERPSAGGRKETTPSETYRLLSTTYGLRDSATNRCENTHLFPAIRPRKLLYRTGPLRNVGRKWLNDFSLPSEEGKKKVLLAFWPLIYIPHQKSQSVHLLEEGKKPRQVRHIVF
ncbi:hypothetical protein CEXT_49431 [Caerostris extrusa]|uniref:Ribosomal protein S10 n=1 Tax=Caerostris extrusa TaxID=172846 RepID=A0AAV4XMH1_CAEEX|nr:hypothetical protein CEXT_49431 [Caerostris extrusa]